MPEETTGWKAKMEGLLSRIGDAASDFSTLDVVTLTGNIKALTEGTGKNFQVKSMTKVLEDATTDANVNVVAFSHIDFDQDTVQFVKSDLTEKEQELWEMHLDTVESAKESRLAALQFVASLVQGH